MARNSKGIDVASILTDRCIGCQICVAECPVGAIEMSGATALVDPEVCIGCGKCKEVCPVQAVNFEGRVEAPAEGPAKEEPASPATSHDGVAVFVEVFQGQGAAVSWELAGKAGELAGKLSTKVIAFLAGHDVEEIARDAIAYGCAEVHVVDDPLLETYSPRPYGTALSELCRAVRPEILLIGATPVGRDLASVIATTIETGLTADCTGLDVDSEKRMLLMTRPTFGGNIMATIYCEHHRPQMATVRPKVFRLLPKDPARRGAIHRHPLTAPEGGVPEVLAFIGSAMDGAGVDITRFPAVVVAGKGACDAETMPMLQQLADAVGGVVACSRPVVEAGLMPYERQVGQTGKTVAPKLYIAVGVSGAVQHLVGMQGSEKILAINSDPKAPIFNVADAGIVGDYRKVVPLLIEHLRRIAEGGRKGA